MESLRKMKHLHYGGRIGLKSDTFLVIKVPDAQILRIVSRSLCLALVLAAFPFVSSIMRGLSSISHSFVPEYETSPQSTKVEQFNSILRDLADEGLLKHDDKALILNPPHGFGSVNLLKNNQIDLVVDSDFEAQNTFPNESYDFVFVTTSKSAKFADRILKINGILVLPLAINPLNAVFKEQSNYEVVYLRGYGSIIVALRKTGSADKLVDSSPKRKLCQFAKEAKTKALKGLEDVLLEPPRQPLTKSKKKLKIKFLPDLLGDSLEGYKRRVFIGVGLPEENKKVTEWFEQNYPKGNAKFEIHSLRIAPEDNLVAPHIDVSAWLAKHVKEEEYVVMKAEAEAVEKMIKKGTIRLVDELFLECKNEWWQNEKRKKNSGRAYWECLALYGRLRDEGVAVHQWWG